MHITLRRDLDGPLYRQVFETLRLAIIEGLWKPEQRLPPSRELAGQLAVSRNTVNTAYDMLRAEGYITARQGAGHYIAANLPHAGLFEQPTAGGISAGRQKSPLSARGAVLASPSRPISPIDNPAFQPGLPDLANFPFRQWQQCLQRYTRKPALSLTSYQDQGGQSDLKQALSDYLQMSRGVDCTAEQIVIISGSQAGLDLLARMLINQGDPIAVEEPGYLGAKDAFRAAGAQLVPVPVDDEGISVKALDLAQRSAPAPIKLVYTTPSYQFPLGITMSASRRMQLLNWATAHNAYVIEDDYDSEFRYRDRPLSSLQGLDQQERVIYLGTFSKVMFPGLRLGYLVLPRHWSAAFALALRKTGQDPPLIWQAAMADFIHSGYFASHLRKMRKLYGEKQQLFVKLLARHLDEWLAVTPTAAGMQLACFYRQATDEQRLLEFAKQQQLNLSALSRYYLQQPRSAGLYLGYAGLARENMEDNVKRLQRSFRALSS